jgi:hypothetical protein
MRDMNLPTLDSLNLDDGDKIGFRELALLKLRDSRSLFEWIQATAVTDHLQAIIEATPSILQEDGFDGMRLRIVEPEDLLCEARKRGSSRGIDGSRS